MKTLSEVHLEHCSSHIPHKYFVVKIFVRKINHELNCGQRLFHKTF